jgi:Domain of unknown function (DUF4136)
MAFRSAPFNKRAWSRGPLLTAFLATATVAGLVGCNGPSVQYDYDARTNYSGYRTFDWTAEPAPAPVPGGGFDNPIMNDRVRRAVETELAAKGFHRDVTTDPDFLITYYPRREPGRSQQVHLGVGFGMGPLGIGVGGPVGDPHREAMAGIVLEIQDYKSRTLVWKATAEGALQGSDDPAQADADVTEAVRGMLKRFPPGK